MEKITRVGIGVMILKDNQILLGKRTDSDKDDPTKLKQMNTWTMPGGKLEYGESFEVAASREVKEETDLDVSDLSIVCLQNDKDDFAHYVTIVMKAENIQGTVKTMEPDKISKWQYFDLNDLPENMYFPSEKAIKLYKLGLFYKKD